MSIPYSNDLRKDDEARQEKVRNVRVIMIDRSTIFRWQKRFESFGNADFKGYNDNQEKIKINKNILEKINKNNPFLTLLEIAKEVGNVSDVTVLNTL